MKLEKYAIQLSLNLLFHTSFTPFHTLLTLDPLFRTVSREPPGPQGSVLRKSSDSSQKVPGKRRWEKAGEGWRRLERVGESSRKFEKLLTV